MRLHCNNPSPSLCPKRTVISMATLIPPGAALHSAFAETWSARYASGSLRRRGQLVASILSKHVRPGSVWLDVGCGSGFLTDVIAKYGGQGAAIDGCPEMIDAAKHTHSNGVNSKFIFQLVDNVEN